MMANVVSTNRDYTLYVANLPEELNEIGIRAIFEHYGKITGFFYRTGTNWAYITYKSYTEAENAMKDLNNVPPLSLRLSLAKEKNSKKENDINSNSFSVSHNGPRKNTECLAHTQSNKPFAKVDEHTIRNGLAYPIVEPTSYGKDVANESADALWARGQMTIASDAKRHVSLGRGYTMYQIPNPHLKVEHLIERVCENRYPGLYQYGNDTLKSQVGSCVNCLNIAKHKCQICHEFYCSQECQIADWPKHKTQCIPVPALVAVTETLPPESPKVEEKIPARRSSNVLMPLRPPKQLMQQNGNTPKAEPERSTITEKKEITQSVVAVQETNTPVEKKVDNRNVKMQNADKIDETIGFQKPEFLSRTKYTDVKVVVKLNDREYWVQKVEDEEVLTKLILKLQDDVEKAPKVVPKVGNICATKYDGLWFRCLVTSTWPLKVHFVDYGNEAVLSETDDIRECKTFKSSQYFAGKIRLPQNASKRYKTLHEDDVLSVKTLSVDKDAVINVVIQGESGEEPPSPSNTITSTPTSKVSLESNSSDGLKSPSYVEEYSKLSKMITILKTGDQGMLEINDESGPNEYGATVLSYYMLSDFKRQIDEMQKDCAEMKPMNPKDMCSGLICGKKDGQWLRGYAMTTLAPYKIIAIDKLSKTDVECAVSCPVKYVGIPAAGVVCRLHRSVEEATASTKLNGQQVHFKVTDCKESNQDSKCVEVEIALATGKVKASLNIWNPLSNTTTQGVASVQFANIKNKASVYIESYRNQGLMYITSMDPKDFEKRLQTNYRIAECAQTAPSLEELPSIGQIVLAPFKDGNHYRALVRSLSMDKVLVSYIDYGNSDFVSPKELRALPVDLQKLPSNVAKVFLKGIPRDVPMTKDVDDYLATIVKEKEVFKYVMENEGVVLKSATGECVNDKIKDLLILNWEKNKGHDDKTCLMLQDLKVISLGNMGETKTVYVLQNLDNSQFIFCAYVEGVISYIRDALPKLLAKYCEAHEHYIPREEELCLVYSETQWLRAVCVAPDISPNSCNVFLVDTGNLIEIEHKNIRAMIKDFMTPNALACVCNVQNLAPKNENGSYCNPAVERRLSELIVNDTIIKVKILVDSDMGAYDVELPDIRQRLIEENLIEN